MLFLLLDFYAFSNFTVVSMHSFSTPINIRKKKWKNCGLALLEICGFSKVEASAPFKRVSYAWEGGSEKILRALVSDAKK